MRLPREGCLGLADGELTQLGALARRLARCLEAPWRARIASVELVVWAVSRESYRSQPAPPNLPAVTGASLVRLTQSRAIPMPATCACSTPTAASRPGSR
ncbi:hypothetical protein ACFY12_08530 [Streptomyces sp. NPDC001339]|uniref:hypothetical protein n=1 Tax=Streptomyces sp. NPDC001339 TaxID=3364563 RepID=UPI0036C2CAA9